MRRVVFVFAAAVLASAAVVGSQISAAEPEGAAIPELLVSRQLFEGEHLAVGQVVELSADAQGTRVRRFRIAGAYEPLPDPMRFAQERLEARVHLPDVEMLTTPRGAAAPPLTAINVQLDDPARAAAFAADVERRLPGLTARATTAPDERASTFAVLERFHLAIAIVTVLGSGVFLLALMVMLIDERREMMATLRLIGFTRGRLLLQVLVEGALIAALGAVAGILFALAMQPVFNRFFQWRYDTALVFLRITPAIVLQSVAMAVPVGMLASLGAGWAVLRQRPLAQVRR
jgi:putative ABC transport system permease protein